jgi:hypothetical protein
MITGEKPAVVIEGPTQLTHSKEKGELLLPFLF